MSIAPPATKIKYLTNKDLLEEIHRSKLSYCSFVDPMHAKYDFIVANISLITQKRIDDARKKKLAEIQAVEKKEHINRGIKDFKSKWSIDDIPAESIVVRVMTYDHIPINPEKVGKAKTEGERHIRCNFPPFQHYIMQDDQLKCVLKSHWQGGLENGYFSKDHGKMTNKLAMMFMKLVDRYGHRGNWRGYCVDTETEALTTKGFLRHDQITENDTILSCCNGVLTWSKIKSIYRGEFSGKMFYLTSPGMDALVTPKHKFLTLSGLKEVEHIDHTDTIVLLGKGVSDLSALQIDAIPRQDLYDILNICNGEMNQGLPNNVSAGGIDFHGGWRGYGPENSPVVAYTGIVWCPETEYGCFVARRNGTIYLTGNSYLEEMKSQALLQLSQVGLQFDESRSDQPNPFAYYTQTITNSFMRILHVEKKNQTIRDDMLIMHDSSPSWTRQTDDAIKQQKDS
jgi:hypothetical protein